MPVFKRTYLWILLLSLCMTAGVSAAETGRKTIFYNLTTDESWAAGMALGQAAMALKEGYGVVVFLNVRAVYLADKSHPQDTFSGTSKTAQEMLSALMEQGARVIICPMCMKKAGIEQSDLISGVEPGGPPVTFPVMTRDDTVVISY